MLFFLDSHIKEHIVEQYKEVFRAKSNIYNGTFFAKIINGFDPLGVVHLVRTQYFPKN